MKNTLHLFKFHIYDIHNSLNTFVDISIKYASTIQRVAKFRERKLIRALLYRTSIRYAIKTLKRLWRLKLYHPSPGHVTLTLPHTFMKLQICITSMS